MKPTFGSLFAGIGGIDLGLERAGWECRWQVEINDYCRKVLEKHWPTIPKYGDVKQIVERELEHVDLIAGGFPCQPVSVAGKRKGSKDERWLWPEFARIIRLVRPRFILVENVPGILSEGFSTVLGDLAEAGYDAEWESLSAAEFGAPHRRFRTFAIAYDREQRMEGFFEGTVQEQPAFSWCENVGRVEDLRGRPDIPEPLFRGASDGVSHWVDRTAAIGNAVVPQVAEWIGSRIIQVAGL